MKQRHKGTGGISDSPFWRRLHEKEGQKVKWKFSKETKKVVLKTWTRCKSLGKCNLERVVTAPSL